MRKLLKRTPPFQVRGEQEAIRSASVVAVADARVRRARGALIIATSLELNPTPLAPRPEVAGYLAFSSLICLILIFLSIPTRAQDTPTPAPPPVQSDLTLLQCGNLTYAGDQSSVCFSDHFLSDVADATNLRVNKTFVPVRLDADALFDFPFCVMSGNDDFTLTVKERQQLRQYLTRGGFLLASPGCSDAQWDAAFRREIAAIFPEYPLHSIPMTHPIFSIVNSIPRLLEKHGNTVSLEGLEINGRLVLVYSKEGLNDVENASGCCCCGGNEVQEPAKVNVNVFTYAAIY
jgi:hypothetical protein